MSPGGGTTTLTDPNGNITTYDYANLELAAVTHGTGTPAAATTRYAYDPATLGIVSRPTPTGTSPRRPSTATATRPAAPTRWAAPRSWPTTARTSSCPPRHRSGHTTSYGYDSNSILQSTTDALGHTTTYAHDDPAHPGDVTGTTDADGRVTTYTYDGAGDTATVSVSPSAGHTDTTSFRYDADGERVCQASAAATAASIACPAAGAPRVAGTTTTSYDTVGEATSVTDPLGHTTGYAYDGNGNRSTVTDPNGHVTTSAYNADDQLTKVTRADGTALTYGYDGNGNQTTQTDAAGHTTA